MFALNIFLPSFYFQPAYVIIFKVTLKIRESFSLLLGGVGISGLYVGSSGIVVKVASL